MAVVDDLEGTTNIVWRGDCAAVDGFSNNLLNQFHKPNGELSIEVGRFMGAEDQKMYYAINKSRETEEITIKNSGVLMLMTDGAYDRWLENKERQINPL